MAKIATTEQSNKPTAQKANYQVTNWQEYNKSLVNRGSITFWFDEDLHKNWHCDGHEQRLSLPKVKGPLCIAFDSTGLKVYGEAEWKYA